MPTVKFLPDDVQVEVPEGETVLDAANRAGVILQSACGGAGTCAKCLLRLIQGEAPPTPEATRGLSAEEVAQGYRLSCQVAVRGDMVFFVPPSARFYGEQILMDGVEDAEKRLRPNVRQHLVELPEPSLRDQRCDVDRLTDALRDRVPGIEVGLEEMRELSGAIHADRFKATATVAAHVLVRTESGDRRGACFGLAFDIGTTTVVGYLVDLATGKDCGRASRTNPQTAFGHDVLSRANYAEQTPNGLWDLQERIVSCLQDLGEELARKASIRADSIYEVVVAGNTIMTHLFLGLSPRYIAQVPFTPIATRSFPLAAAEVGLRFFPRARLVAMPCVAGYVGGDITAGMVATRLDERKELTLFIDIGTNGELVLAQDGKMLACAAPAGPAFEGARISCGTRAVLGSIDRVRWSGEDLAISTIGGRPARGICGTGLIDIVRCLLEANVVDSTGRVGDPGGLPPKMAARLRGSRDSAEILLVPKEKTEDGTRDLVLTQRDVRELQLAKGAIRSGVDMVLKLWGASAQSLDRVLLAGGFGNYIDRHSARAIGLLPWEVPVERIEFVGNSAGVGAKMALVDTARREHAQKLALQTQYVELSGRPDFSEAFMGAMIFPER